MVRFPARARLDRIVIRDCMTPGGRAFTGPDNVESASMCNGPYGFFYHIILPMFRSSPVFAGILQSKRRQHAPQVMTSEEMYGDRRVMLRQAAIRQLQRQNAATGD